MQRAKQWSAVQNLDYYFFLTLKYKQLGQRKKSTRLYVEMSNFIQTKTPIQCRTHHEKRLNQWKKSENPEMRLLHKFYREYYTMRKIDISHMRYELAQCLQDKRLQRIITEAQFQAYQNNLDQNLKEIGFQNSNKQFEEKECHYSEEQKSDERSNDNSSQQIKNYSDEEQDVPEIIETQKRIPFDLQKSQEY